MPQIINTKRNYAVVHFGVLVLRGAMACVVLAVTGCSDCQPQVANTQEPARSVLQRPEERIAALRVALWSGDPDPSKSPHYSREAEDLSFDLRSLENVVKAIQEGRGTTRIPPLDVTAQDVAIQVLQRHLKLDPRGLSLAEFVKLDRIRSDMFLITLEVLAAHSPASLDASAVLADQPKSD